MKSMEGGSRFIRWILLWVLAAAMVGCASRGRPNWQSRIGTYTLDDGIKEFGPPAARDKTSDGVVVVEWLIQKGLVYSTPAPAWMGGGWGRWMWGTSAVDINSTPDEYLRLQFGPDGRLAAWKRVYK